MNTQCANSTDGRHGFTQTHVTDRYDDGQPFAVRSYHTCISCGHRRAIDALGVLWYYDADKEQWYKKLDVSEAA